MALAAFEDWSATWDEKHPEFDAEKAKKLIYNLERDKENLKAEKATVATERDTVKSELSAIKAKDETENQRLTRELEEARKNPPKAVNKLEILLARGAEKELTVAQINAAARYVSGDTADEIEKNFDDYVTDHNLVAAEGDGKNGKGPQTQPKMNTNKVTGVEEVDNGVADDGHFKDKAKALAAHRASQ